MAHGRHQRLVEDAIEGLGLAADRLRLTGAFWNVIGYLNDHFSAIGYLIVGVFLFAWLLSAAMQRANRLEQPD